MEGCEIHFCLREGKLMMSVMMSVMMIRVMNL